MATDIRSGSGPATALLGLAWLGASVGTTWAEGPPTAPPRAVLARALRAANAVEAPTDRADDLLIVAQSQARYGLKDEAWETLRQALAVVEAADPDAPWTLPHPILRIAEARAEDGDRDEAHRIYKKAVALTRRMDDAKAGSFWEYLLPFQFKVDRPEAVRVSVDAYREFVDKRGSTVDRSFAPSTFVAWQARLGDVPSALKTIKPLPIEACRDALADLAEVRATLGDLDGALGLVDRIDDPARRDRALLRSLAALPAPEPVPAR